jgi:hypothetical protein
MTPVMQTRFGHDGNCLPACVVSILDMPDALEELSDVLVGAKDWTQQRLRAVRWLRAYGVTCVPLLPWDTCCEEFIRGCLCIGEGQSARGLGHAVVWCDGLIHDPHPDGTGLTTAPETYSVLAPLSIDGRAVRGKP